MENDRGGHALVSMATTVSLRQAATLAASQQRNAMGGTTKEILVGRTATDGVYLSSLVPAG
eukprot:2012437-Lingulodinium_polyedra.AAC.1